jgi:4-amino-4-deoxy-L-arabinose transferase-like glycosyltransferase
VSAAGTVLFTYLMARRLGSRLSGFIAGAVLLSMWRFLWCSSLRALEPISLFLMTASLSLYLEWTSGSGWKRPLPLFLAALSSSGAFLLEGLTGLCVPALAVFTFHAGERNLQALFKPKAMLAALIPIGVAASWALTLWLALGAEALEPRALAHPFLGAAGPGTSTPPAWAPCWWLFSGTLPASILAPFALFAHIRMRRYREDLGLADRRWRFPKAALVSGLLFYTLLPLKDPLLLLPLFPVLALLIAAWMERSLSAWRRKKR